MNASRTAGGPPATLRISPDGALDGRTRRYEKRLEDLAGIYRDGDAWKMVVDGMVLTKSPY